MSESEQVNADKHIAKAIYSSGIWMSITADNQQTLER